MKGPRGLSGWTVGEARHAARGVAQVSRAAEADVADAATACRQWRREWGRGSGIGCEDERGGLPRVSPRSA